MPETQPSTPLSQEAPPIRNDSGTIQDQGTSIPASPEAKPAPTPTPPTSETKTEAKSDGKSPDNKSLLGKEGPAQGAPEQYSDFKVPEGFTLDAEVAQEASALFKEANISQASAQKLVDFYIKKAQESHDQPYQQYEETRKTWKDEINADPNIGGSKLRDAVASINKMIDSISDTKLADGFREAMNYTGAGDNPDVVRLLHALSLRLGEGTAVRGNGPTEPSQRAPGQDRPSAAQAMYPHLPSNRG